MIDVKKKQIKELLKIHYGFEKFWPGQERAIDNILAGRNQIVIMPTGGGKSLIYQLPALVLEGTSLVISPLIALMKDQVDFLEKAGIPATFINSSISPDEAKKRIEQVKEGYFKLLYVAPERFYNQEFVKNLSDIKVSLFAIDEAHCISYWGHDFRPSYLRLKNVIEILGKPPVVALTATATPEVREDIVRQLDLRDPDMIVTGFARPNLQFGAVKARDSQKIELIIEAALGMEGKSGIIYTGTRAKADEIAQGLLENHMEAVAYHAGMDNESRHWAQESFLSGKTKIIVATNAFGLGIDKKDVRFIIHHDLPGTVEAYYQEAGRAGRDGEPAFCLLLYAPRDRYLREFFIKGDNPSPKVISEVYDIVISSPEDEIITTYSQISEDLSEEVPEMAIGTSLKILEKEGYIARNSEKTSQAYLKLVNSFEKTMDFVSKKAKKQIEILEKLNKRFASELEEGWELNLDETAGIIEVERESLVRTINNLKKNELAIYNPPKRGTEIKILKRVEPDELELDFKSLRQKARRAYEKLDKMEDYVYFSDCRQKYILNYFSDFEISKCGKCDNCLNKGGHIQDERGYFKKKKGEKRENGEFKVGEKKNVLNTKLTQLETLELYNKGTDLDEIAKIRVLKRETIINHICFLIEKGLIKDIDDLVSKKKQEKIKKVLKKEGNDKLKPIKEKLGDDFSYEEIKITRSFLNRKINE